MDRHHEDRTARQGAERGASSNARAGAQSRHGRLPEPLKSTIEQLGGHSMDDVEVHHGSSRPAQIRAHAYTQGNHIHLAPGQEHHLAHEAWHVVQQRRETIRPTMQRGGMAINDSPALEREAHEMGSRALASTQGRSMPAVQPRASSPSPSAPVQAYFATQDAPNNRMSDGDQFILVGSKALFAKAAAIEASNEALHEAGAIVSLGLTDSSINVSQGVFRRIKLVPDQENLDASVWDRMKAVASPDAWRTYADCYRNSATVSGMKKGLDQGGTLELKGGAIPLLTQAQMNTKDHSMEVPGNVAGQARMTLFQHAFPRIRATLNAADSVAHAALIGKIDEYLAKKPTYIEANKVYMAITKSPAALALFNAQFGVNTDIVPRVGLALTQVNDENLTKYLNGLNQDKWNFHWAGIIMVDGSDYVTLENCAVEMGEVTPAEYLADRAWFDDPRTHRLASDKKMDIVNERWYFKLHGKGDQSFHAENLKDSHSTPTGITLPLSHA